MLTHDAADDPRAVEFLDPVAIISAKERDDEEAGKSQDIDQSVEAQVDRAERRTTRDCAIKFILQLHKALSFILETNSREETEMRLLIVASAYSHPITSGKSDWALAAMCNTSRANWGARLTEFQRRGIIPIRAAQKSIESRKTYSEKRISQLAKP